MTLAQSNYIKDLMHRKGFEESEFISIILNKVGINTEENMDQLSNWKVNLIVRWLRTHHKNIDGSIGSVLKIFKEEKKR